MSKETTSGESSKNTLYCSFCGKSQHEVRKLIAGPTVFICDECVELCMDIIREENKTKTSLERGVQVKLPDFKSSSSPPVLLYLPQEAADIPAIAAAGERPNGGRRD